MDYSTSDYLTQLQQDREDLVDNLEAKGITGLTGDETFTELVPEVLNIPSGGGVDLHDYYDYEPTSIATDGKFLRRDFFKKFPDIIVPNTISDISSMLAYLNTFYLPKVICSNSVTNMSNLCANANWLQEIDLSGLDTSNVTNMSTMFSACTTLNKIDMRSFDFTNVTNYTNMFGASASIGPANNCLIIVKDNTAKTWINTKFSRLTNVQTVEEYEASLNS